MTTSHLNLDGHPIRTLKTLQLPPLPARPIFLYVLGFIAPESPHSLWITTWPSASPLVSVHLLARFLMREFKLSFFTGCFTGDSGVGGGYSSSTCADAGAGADCKSHRRRPVRSDPPTKCAAQTTWGCNRDFPVLPTYIIRSRYCRQG